jgi:hypothetical protein
MTEDAKQAWSEVADRFSAWGKRVADRYHEADEGGEAKAAEAERDLTEAAKGLFDELAKGVKAFGATIKDQEANAELSDAVSALGNAITASVTEATDAIRSKGSNPPPPPEG